MKTVYKINVANQHLFLTSNLSAAEDLVKFLTSQNVPAAIIGEESGATECFGVVAEGRNVAVFPDKNLASTLVEKFKALEINADIVKHYAFDE